jgi:hypothetical protein
LSNNRAAYPSPPILLLTSISFEFPMSHKLFVVERAAYAFLTLSSLPIAGLT